ARRCAVGCLVGGPSPPTHGLRGGRVRPARAVDAGGQRAGQRPAHRRGAGPGGGDRRPGGPGPGGGPVRAARAHGPDRERGRGRDGRRRGADPGHPLRRGLL
ncbi:MAG: hypothetical protein AVDCRST_MAG19-768, partial [uncultured Thermomicrobiales bacterium]